MVIYRLPVQFQLDTGTYTGQYSAKDALPKYYSLCLCGCAGPPSSRRRRGREVDPLGKIKMIIKRGFTLVEVLVAVSLLALGIMAIFEVFIVSWDSRIRAENYARVVVVAVDEFEKAEEIGLPMDDSGNLSEGNRSFNWTFQQSDVDIEYYPKLKEIDMNMQWQEGKRSGTYNLATFFWDPPLE